MKTTRILGVAVMSIGLVGAAATDSRAQNDTLLGGLLGGAAGAGIGAAFGGGKGAAIGGISGLLLGALAGNSIANNRDRYDPPPQQGYYAPPPTYYGYQQPAGYAPAYAAPQGYAAPPAYVPQAVPAPVAQAPAYSANYCRDFTQTIIIDGVEKNAYGKACLQPDGSWRIVNMN